MTNEERNKLVQRLKEKAKREDRGATGERYTRYHDIRRGIAYGIAWAADYIATGVWDK